MTVASNSDDIVMELKARQDIHDVLVRYCRGADRCDLELMESCFHDDATDDHGFFNGPAHEFIARDGLRKLFQSSKHFMTNESVELDGDRARSETSILALMRREEGGALYDVTMSARYLDRFERRNGAWKISHRILVTDSTRVDRVEREDPALNAGQRGCRGKDDPYYLFFGTDRAATRN